MNILNSFLKVVTSYEKVCEFHDDKKLIYVTTADIFKVFVGV